MIQIELSKEEVEAVLELLCSYVWDEFTVNADNERSAIDKLDKALRGQENED